MTTVEVLTKARERLTPEGAWCQRSFARNQDGFIVGASSPDACSYCMVGAVASVCLPSSEIGTKALDALKNATNSIRIENLFFLNDRPQRTQADVLAIYDRAIAAEQAKQPALKQPTDSYTGFHG